MVAADKRIESLVKLTKGRSKTDRTLLYRHIAHLINHRQKTLKGDNNPPIEDTEILFELFDALSSQVDVETRCELAQDLSRMPEPPMPLIMRLAVDNIAVAGAVLKSAPFNEKELLEIINKTDKTHHLIIAERSDLSQKLWQTIVNSREPNDSPENIEQKPEKRLIRFPAKPKSATSGTKYRAIDLFVPGNDQSPPLEQKAKNHKADELPAYYLGEPPQSPEPASQPTSMGDDAIIYWSVGRRGEIVKIDRGAETIFNTTYDELIKQNLWQLLDVPTGSDLYSAITKHHPIRNLSVMLQGTNTQLRMIGHALFDRATGRFEGFDGTFRPVDSENSITKKPQTKKQQSKQQKLPQNNVIDDPQSGHVLAGHLSADASAPIQDMLEGIQRIARAARRNNDETMLTDIRSVMADCFKIRDMVEDTERIARMFGGTESLGDESFDVFKVLNSCLDDDTTRHGNISCFQLLPQTTDPMVRFSRTILKQAFARMLEMARESSHSAQPIPIYVHAVEDGRLEVTIPLGSLTGDKSIDARELNTDDRLKLGVVRRKRSGDTVMTASLGLSALSGSINRLGGKLDIIQDYHNAAEPSLGNKAGSVSIRLPTV